MNEVYYVVIDGGIPVASFRSLEAAQANAVQQYLNTNKSFRFRVFGGDTCYLDTDDEKFDGDI